MQTCRYILHPCLWPDRSQSEGSGPRCVSLVQVSGREGGGGDRVGWKGGGMRYDMVGGRRNKMMGGREGWGSRGREKGKWMEGLGEGRGGREEG